jgi:hypothetical protein
MLSNFFLGCYGTHADMTQVLYSLILKHTGLGVEALQCVHDYSSDAYLYLT